MGYDPKIHHRRSIRVPGYDYSGPGMYFVTIVAQGRACLFGEVVGGVMVLNAAGEMVRTVYESIAVRFPLVELGIYVIMPNHFHAIIIIHEPVGATLVVAQNVAPTENRAGTSRAGTSPAPTGPTLGGVVGAFKSITTHAYIQGVKELGWMPFDKRLWQRNYYEHIIHNEEDANRIHNYIESNPAKWEDDDENPAK